MPSPAIPGMFFSFAAMALLLFASISPPAWERVNFLQADVGGTSTVFGVLGLCVKGGSCSGKNVGYNLAVNGASNLNINPSGLHNLTYTLVLHPIAGFFGLLAFVMGLLGIAAASRFSTVMMAVSAFIGGVITLVAFVIDMVLWNLVKQRVNNAGYHATLGNANWFTVGAFVAFVLAMCTSFCGAFGRFASGRAAGEKY